METKKEAMMVRIAWAELSRAAHHYIVEISFQAQKAWALGEVRSYSYCNGRPCVCKTKRQNPTKKKQTDGLPAACGFH